MTALHAPTALPALADGHAEGPHDRPHDREIFLILRRVTVQAKGPAIVRTGGRQWPVASRTSHARESVGVPSDRWRRQLCARIDAAGGAASHAKRAPLADASRAARPRVPLRAGRSVVAVLLSQPIRLAPQLVDIAGDLVPFTSHRLVVTVLPFNLGDEVLTTSARQFACTLSLSHGVVGSTRGSYDARAAQMSSRSLRPAKQIQALFPRYIFVRFRAAEMLAKVRLTRAFRGIVGFGDVVRIVDDPFRSSVGLFE